MFKEQRLQMFVDNMKKEPAQTTTSIIPTERVERQIYLIRGIKMMLDSDLAELYQVETKALNQAVRRNLDRFPADFMLELTKEEALALRSQIVTLESGRGRYSKYAPMAFTEQGVAMLSSVLKSKRAVQMNIIIIRAFVKLREVLYTHKDMAERIEKIENNQERHASVIKLLADEIDKMQALPQEPPKDPIGFRTD